jgi:hypothetical protein
MAQPTFTQIRQALAATLNTIPGLRATANRNAQVNPPAAVIMPAAGSFIRYSVTTDGAADITLRAILLVAEADSASGQDNIDPYLASTGPSSVWAALQANQTLGGAVSYAELTEATGYGTINFAGIDYLGCHLIISIGI